MFLPPATPTTPPSTWPAPSSGYHLPPSAGCSATATLPTAHCPLSCPLSTAHRPLALAVPPPMPCPCHPWLPGHALTTPVPPVAFIISSPRSCFCFLSLRSHTSTSSFHLSSSTLFPPLPSTEFRIRRFSTSLVANSSSFVDVWIQVLRVSLLPFVCLQLAAVQVTSLCSHGLSAVAAPPNRSRLHPFDVHISGGF